MSRKTGARDADELMKTAAGSRDVVCRCGHGKTEHDVGDGCCGVSEDGIECYCMAFDSMAWGDFEADAAGAALVEWKQ
ncbi:MAG: hypothetical protein ACREQM_13655 [Candidatus Dormibacteraceae bacterium]